MNEEAVNKMLDQEYQIKLSGGMLGYMLTLLADRQRALGQQMEDDITDAMAAMTAAVNDMVGNHLLHEAYRVAGAKFLALSIGGNEKDLETIMTSTDKDEIKSVVRKAINPRGLN